MVRSTGREKRSTIGWEDGPCTAGSALRSREGHPFAGMDFGFTATATPAPPADIDTVSEVDWQGQPALRVRFTQPLGPLAARSLAVERNGAAVLASPLTTTDPREVILVLPPAAAKGPWDVRLDGGADAAGRPLPFRRLRSASVHPGAAMAAK
ncbi:MAG: hypothetical protein SFV54_04985 [Bryobacteraceae bacterium]|nr:hypothetical protein [Bryobacteraceae bacterium]